MDVDHFFDLSKRRRRQIISKIAAENLRKFMEKEGANETTALANPVKRKEPKKPPESPSDCPAEEDSAQVFVTSSTESNVEIKDAIGVDTKTYMAAKLRFWVLRHSISNRATVDLLKILKEFGLDVPMSHEGLLPATIEEDFKAAVETSEEVPKHFLPSCSVKNELQDLISFNTRSPLTNKQNLPEPSTSAAAVALDEQISAEHNYKENTVKCITHPIQIDDLSLKFIAQQLAHISAKVDKAMGMVPSSKDLGVTFPICSIEDLESIEERLNDDDFKRPMIEVLRKFAPVDGSHSTTGLTKILNDDMIMMFTWDGKNTYKQGLNDYSLFREVLYESWAMHFGENYRNFESSIRKQMSQAHNRIRVMTLRIQKRDPFADC